MAEAWNAHRITDPSPEQIERDELLADAAIKLKPEPRRGQVRITVTRRSGKFTVAERSRIYGATNSSPLMTAKMDRCLEYRFIATAERAEDIAQDIRREFPRCTVTLIGDHWE